MSGQTYPMNQGEFELARRLEAYAERHLSPSTATASRMRSAVMVAAHRRAAMVHADPSLATVAPSATMPRARRPFISGSPWRRPMAAVLVGGLTLFVLAGTALAARPGGPLYAARLWTETAVLPADSLDRAKAEVARLDERIVEVQSAVSAGDGGAIAAAMTAYSTILTEAARDAGTDPEAMATLQAAVARHLAVLTQLLDRVPLTARAAIENALASSSKALYDLQPGVAHPGIGTPAGTGRDGEHGAPGPGANGGGGPPTGTPKPEATPKGGQNSAPSAAPPSDNGHSKETTPPGQTKSPKPDKSAPNGRSDSATH